MCDLCGICLHKCPVLRLPIEEAKEEIKRLIEGKKSKYALSKCNTCFSCNLYCPNDANPYQLILERWNDSYKEKGAPPLYRFVCPTETPNIWQLLNLFLSDQEKKWIFDWVTHIPKKTEKILIIGNYTHLFPFIIGGSKLLDYFTPISRIDQWEGGAYLYQGGYLNVVQEIAERCQQDFNDWGVEDITHILDAVEYIFSEVHPNEMNTTHSQEFDNLNGWLLEKIDEGELKLKEKLNLSVTVHDNCYSKSLEGRYWDDPRKILKLCGCKILEMEHIKEDSLCCGFGAGASWVNNFSIPFDIISEGTKKFKEAIKTGAKALITYCTGCYYLLWATKEIMNYDIEVFHLIEIVRMAMGEKLDYPYLHKKRAWDIIAIITYQLIKSLFHRNFYIKNITYDKKMSTFIPKSHILLRIIRKILDFSIGKRAYSKIFQLSLPFIKTR
ncbi:MAG: hypothetical protein BAJALOKI2v1_160029 [Promethearchaeota archaeon]|nr:MAG: hypothetical protein BAJALOKI2v1_160029 [Candidatus Lokiarchaeota archaeon]